mgnify:CR=1 FL=1
MIDKPCPDFELPATGNSTFKLSAAKGRHLVLYFYPKDDTPGCTLEGKDFRDQHGNFKRLQVRILGVSRDSLASHEKFRNKYELPFELVADTDEALCQLFDVIKDKNMYGKKVRGVERSTFLVDASGVLRQEWRKVKVDGHVAQVLAAVEKL